MVIVLWIVPGCSGSSDPDSSDSQPDIMSAPISSSNDSSDSPSNENANESGSESDADVGTNNNANSSQNGPLNNDPVVEDPLIQSRVLVSFEITVSAYQASQLRVELLWGEIILAAMWVGDELWSASGEFPSHH